MLASFDDDEEIFESDSGDSEGSEGPGCLTTAMIILGVIAVILALISSYPWLLIAIVLPSMAVILWAVRKWF